MGLLGGWMLVPAVLLASAPCQASRVSTKSVSSPYVKASSGDIHMNAVGDLLVEGADFNPETKLIFDPPLPEGPGFRMKVFSRDLVVVSREHVIGGASSPWRAEPGPLKVVAIDTGTGVVPLDPTQGGVVVAVATPDVVVQDNANLRIYQSTKRFQITGSGFEDGMQGQFSIGGDDEFRESVDFTITDLEPNRMTFNLLEGRTWPKAFSYYPKDLVLQYTPKRSSSFMPRGPVDTIAGVSPLCSKTRALTAVGKRYTTVRELWKYGVPDSMTGLNPSWNSTSRWTRVSFKPSTSTNSKIDLVEIDFKSARAPAGYFGPLKIKAVDAGAGMVLLDPPVEVATIVPMSTQDFFLQWKTAEKGFAKHRQDCVDQAAREWQGMALDEQTRVAAWVVPSPLVKASSRVLSKSAHFLSVDGANFNQQTTLIFDPPLPEEQGFRMLRPLSSSTSITIHKTPTPDGASNPWRAKPGPLKVVAIDTGTGGVLQLNPEGGGVTVAVVNPEIAVQKNGSLRIYQSTKELRVNGRGFEDGMQVRSCSWISYLLMPEDVDFTITDTKPDQLTLNLVDGGTWIKDPAILPGALLLRQIQSHLSLVQVPLDGRDRGPVVATVLEDPTIDTSDINLLSSDAHQLTISGSGFNPDVLPILDFDPPIDSKNIHIDVVDRTMIRLSLPATLSRWTMAESYVGPLKVKGVDAGAGHVVFDAPVTVATFVADLDAHEESAAQIY